MGTAASSWPAPDRGLCASHPEPRARRHRRAGRRTGRGQNGPAEHSEAVDAHDALDVLDEGVLHRSIASPEVMKGQFEHLLEVGENLRVSLQIIPYKACSAVGLLGGFVVAEMPRSAAPVAYIDSQSTEDRVTDRPEEVKGLAFKHDVIRADALSRHESLGMIKEMARRWTT